MWASRWVKTLPDSSITFGSLENTMTPGSLCQAAYLVAPSGRREGLSQSEIEVEDLWLDLPAVACR